MAAVVLPALTGCGIMTTGGQARLTSMESGAVLAPDLPTRVYVSQDQDSADFYMTDLPASVWNGGADVSDMAGMFVQVHMFLRPKAGRTPIADTASTAVIRCVVLAKGEIGVYGGGGFFVNDGQPGEKTFEGSVRNGSLRLVSATEGFVDRLGPCSFAGAVSGKKDQKTADEMERAVRALVADTKAVGKASADHGAETGPPQPESP
jgi:hypothetical protein